MKRACDIASESVKNHTGPFGAVIADKQGNIVAEGNNMVTLLNDPTMHAEMSVIRNACKKLGTFKLDGLVIYSSCEPCPMCLGAIYWARL
jgi:guanine deaminase